MAIKKRMLTLLTISILLLSTLAALSRNLTPKANASNGDGATLTGSIIDWGKDTDNDTKYNYLEVAIQINVSSEGDYRVDAILMAAPPKNYTYMYGGSNESHLSVGLRWLNLSYFGPKIYTDRVNVSAIGQITLYKDYGLRIDSIPYIPFSRVYNYTDFDCLAVLTGNIHDEGIDTDGDGLFNSLQIGVEINVTDPAAYTVDVSNLYGTAWVFVSNSSQVFLNPGIRIINVTLNGAKIYASHANISAVSSISLYAYKDSYYIGIGQIYSHQLNRTYSYTEFDSYAFFTGTILDEGIDEDHNGLYDYLNISVEVNVTDAGLYAIQFNNLVGNNYSDYVYEHQYFQGKLEVGLHFINFTVYGPKIYSAHVNPVYVQNLWLDYAVPMGQYSWNWINLEQINMMQLPVLYSYSQFESHAILTGKINDRGVDSDGDGLFDYLEVGVEVNVTKTGKYGISIEYLTGNGYEYYYYQYFENDLSVGIHVINFTFPGPMIAYYHINPTTTSSITLTEPEPYYQLSYIDTIELPTKYNYTQFNFPSHDMQIEFTVYPNATVGVRGLFNYTHMYSPYSYPPSVNATLGFSTSGDMTTGSANGTVMFPENSYYWHQFPYNSTNANFAYQYYNGMLNANLNATVTLPRALGTEYLTNASFSFLDTYSDGMLNVDLSGNQTLSSLIASKLPFPFNVTDFTVLADYKDNEMNGNITFHILSGFPLSDVILHFNGNKTEISFTGNLTVVYGNYDNTEINSTVLEGMLTQINSTIPGRGDHSLYNMTQGLIECTRLNTTMTPLTGPLEGATVDYNATLHGNFTQLLAYAVTGLFGLPGEARPTINAALNATLSSVTQGSLVLDYYHESRIGTLHLALTSNVKALWQKALQLIPPTVPSEYRNQTETFLKIANITAYAVEDQNLDVRYSSDTQQLSIHASLAANITKLKDEIIRSIDRILPETVPPQLKDLVKSCTNTTYCKLVSLNATCNYINGAINFDAKWLLKGDLTAQISHIKSCYVQYLNLTSPWMLNWQMRMLNATEIDISNFKADVRMGEDWMTLTFEGLKLGPVKDEVDPVRFKLYRLFNMTSSGYESPQEFEKLKLTIIGGSNATNTVLLYAPTAVPSPNNTSSDYKVMIWQNTTLSSLKDLVFQIAYQEVIPYLRKDYYVFIFTNSTESGFTHDFSNTNAPSISFNVSGATGMGFCNITIPRSLLDATLGNWTVKIDGIPLLPGNFTVTQNDDYVFIYLTYPHSVHTIEIVGTWVVTEFPPSMLPLILVILSFIAAIIVVKKRKRLSTLKTKYQGTINTLAKILHQLGT